MWIQRDLLRQFRPYSGLEVASITGPRQVGKTSLMLRAANTPSLLELDDLQIRTRAKEDPALALADKSYPILVDEFQYAPELLPEIKLRVDRARRAGAASLMFIISGSNQLDVAKGIRETLSGRISNFKLHGLSAAELFEHNPKISISSLLWRGGYPELYRRPELDPRAYLSDYISTFIEKDIARSAGIEKQDEFLTVLQLLAARVAEILNFSSIAQDSGVAPKTVTEWVSILESSRIIETLPVYSTNLNTRLTKAPKVFFLDSGLLSRLQGHLAESSILSVPQAGHIFENLILSEVAKLRDHCQLPLKLSYWRTRDGEEIDLVIETGTKTIFVEAKLGIQNVRPIEFSKGLRKVFPGTLTGIVATPGGTRQRLSDESEQVPINLLAQVLKDRLA